MIGKTWDRTDETRKSDQKIRADAVNTALTLAVSTAGWSADDVVRAAAVVEAYVRDGTVPPVNAAAKA